MTSSWRADAYATLLRWCRERELVRLRKEAGLPRPWTADLVLREWRFCCVSRERDRETRWVARNWRDPRTSSPALWHNLVVAVLCRRSATLAELGFQETWDPERFVRVLEGRPRGEAFGAAYVVPGGPGGATKARWLADACLTPLWEAHVNGTEPPEARPGDGPACAAWARFLRMRAAGLGPFLANQVVADLRRTRYLSAADDWGCFVLCGPGTLRGLDRLAGRPLGSSQDGKAAREEVLRVRDALQRDAPELERELEDPNDTANCLCEYDKYARALEGGRPKRRYMPSAEPLP